MKEAYFAGGCFWCISDYILVKCQGNVMDVICGYSGGQEKEATYELVKSQKSKHRETIKIIYDEKKISLNELLSLYVEYVDIHDKDGQYIDKGYSYTLALFYQNKEEQEIYQHLVKSLAKPCYISIEPFKFFVEAESKHQHYSSNNPEAFKRELLKSNRTCHLALKK